MTRDYDMKNCPKHASFPSALFRTLDGEWLICTATSTNDPGYPGDWACGYREVYVDDE